MEIGRHMYRGLVTCLSLFCVLVPAFILMIGSFALRGSSSAVEVSACGFLSDYLVGAGVLFLLLMLSNGSLLYYFRIEPPPFTAVRDNPHSPAVSRPPGPNSMAQHTRDAVTAIGSSDAAPPHLDAVGEGGAGYNASGGPVSALASPPTSPPGPTPMPSASAGGDVEDPSGPAGAPEHRPTHPVFAFALVSGLLVSTVHLCLVLGALIWIGGADADRMSVCKSSGHIYAMSVADIVIVCISHIPLCMFSCFGVFFVVLRCGNHVDAFREKIHYANASV